MSIENKDIDQIEYVDVRVTPETMDAHVQCLRENGYKINKPFSLFTSNMFLSFLLTKEHPTCYVCTQTHSCNHPKCIVGEK